MRPLAITSYIFGEIELNFLAVLLRFEHDSVLFSYSLSLFFEYAFYAYAGMTFSEFFFESMFPFDLFYLSSIWV